MAFKRQRGSSPSRAVEVDAQMRSALGEFTDVVEVRLQAEIDRNRQTQMALADAVTKLRDDIAARDAELARALEKLGRILDRSAECIEDDRHERRALVDALVALAQSVGNREPAPAPAVAIPRPERVLGGTVFGTADIELVPDLDEHEGTGVPTFVHKRADEVVPNIAGLEVQCRFGGDWVDGFEVFDVLQDGDELRYRLRRLSDGSIPSKLFDVSEVRPKHDEPTLEREDPKPRRTWSRPEWV